MIYGIAAFAIVVISYPLVMRLFARAVSARREKMVLLASIIADDETFPAELRPMVAWMLETAFSARLMAFVAVALPWLAIEALRGGVSPTPEIKNAASNDAFDDLVGHHLSSMAAANPIFAIIASLEFAVIGFVCYPLGKMSSLARISFGALAKAERRDHAHA